MTNKQQDGKPEAQAAGVGPPWRTIDDLPESDDLFWFLRWDSVGGYTEDGPRRPQAGGYDADEWTWFAVCESPPISALTTPASHDAQQPVHGHRTMDDLQTQQPFIGVMCPECGAEMRREGRPHRRRATAMADVTMKPCGDCGMPCTSAEYHPYAACLMFKACHNSATVRANLPDYEALRKRCEAVEAALRDCLQAMDVARDTIQPITQAQVKLHGLDPATANKLDAAASKALAAIAAAQEPSHG